MFPKSSFIILEKNSKKHIGGRMNNYNFKGTMVNIGAGIGRKEKDDLLIDLLKELKIKYSNFIVQIDYAKTLHKVDINKIFNLLKKKYNNDKKTFKQFALPILGSELYNNLIDNIGYTDYENEDVHEVLFNYGMEDNQSGWTGMGILWSELINKLVTKVGLENIKTSNTVKSIKNKDDVFYVHTNKKIYNSRKVIIGTTIDTVQKLLPDYKIYNQIHGQTFLRVYGQFSKSSIPIISEYVKTNTVVPTEIKKIIPITDDIYMIAYTDNDDALYLKKKNVINNNSKNRNFYCRLIEKSLGIKENSLNLLAIKSFYWEIGTHYYEPLSKEYKNRDDFIHQAQNPMLNMFVVGEMISRNQGWTLGALQSVQKILKVL
jgi:hypothetical protein